MRCAVFAEWWNSLQIFVFCEIRVYGGSCGFVGLQEVIEWSTCQHWLDCFVVVEPDLISSHRFEIGK